MSKEGEGEGVGEEEEEIYENEEEDQIQGSEDDDDEQELEVGGSEEEYGEQEEEEEEDKQKAALERVVEQEEEEPQGVLEEKEEEKEESRSRLNEAIVAQGQVGGEQQQVIQGTTRKGPSPTLGTLWLLSALAFYVFMAGCIGASVGLENAAIAIILPLISLAATGGKITAEIRGKDIPAAFDILLGVLLVVIWTISVFVFTFQAPFLTPGTGFFSTWLSLVFSVYYTVLVWNLNLPEPDIDSYKERGIYKQDLTPICAVAFFTSGGVISQSAAIIIVSGVADGLNVFALVVGVLSAVILGILMVCPGDFIGEKTGFFVMSVFVLVMWFLVVLFCTLGAPFFVGGVVANGFFSVWVSFLASTLLVWKTTALVRKDKDSRIKIKSRWLFQGQLFVMSFIVLVAGATTCPQQCDGLFLYGILSGTFSMAACAGAAISFKDNPERAKGDIKFGTNTFNEVVSAVVLFIWWLVAVILLTFPPTSPFFVTSSGYIAVWTSFVFATLYLNQIFPGLLNILKSNECLNKCIVSCAGSEGSTRKSRYGVVVSALGLVVETFALVVTCIDVSAVCSGIEVYGLVMIGLSAMILAVIVYAKPSNLGHGAIGLNLLFIFIWYITLAVLTLDVAIIVDVGNGYYASWAILGGGIYTLMYYPYDFTMIEDMEEEEYEPPYDDEV